MHSHGAFSLKSNNNVVWKWSGDLICVCVLTWCVSVSDSGLFSSIQCQQQQSTVHAGNPGPLLHVQRRGGCSCGQQFLPQHLRPAGAALRRPQQPVWTRYSRALNSPLTWSELTGVSVTNIRQAVIISLQRCANVIPKAFYFSYFIAVHFFFN